MSTARPISAEQSAAAALLPPSSRPLDANCDALLEMMNHYHVYAAASKVARNVQLRIDYTLVQMPYGWEKITDPQTGGVYYYNLRTGEARCDRKTRGMRT